MCFCLRVVFSTIAQSVFSPACPWGRHSKNVEGVLYPGRRMTCKCICTATCKRIKADSHFPATRLGFVKTALHGVRSYQALCQIDAGCCGLTCARAMATTTLISKAVLRPCCTDNENPVSIPTPLDRRSLQTEHAPPPLGTLC